MNHMSLFVSCVRLIAICASFYRVDLQSGCSNVSQFQTFPKVLTDSIKEVFMCAVIRNTAVGSH